MNPKHFCTENGIATKDFINTAKTVAPQYDKIVHSLCSNPQRGCVVSPAIAALFKPPKSTRKKPNQFTFRLANDDRTEFHKARAFFGHDVQTATEVAIALYIEKAALEAGTSKTAKVNNTTASIAESEDDVNAVQ